MCTGYLYLNRLTQSTYTKWDKINKKVMLLLRSLQDRQRFSIFLRTCMMLNEKSLTNQHLFYNLALSMHQSKCVIIYHKVFLYHLHVGRNTQGCDCLFPGLFQLLNNRLIATAIYDREFRILIFHVPKNGSAFNPKKH